VSDPELAAPEILGADHDFSSFSSGTPLLDDWLRRRALGNQESGASRTYTICADRRVVGYYALAVGAVAHAEATGRTRRNMPDPVSVMVLGRLAIDAGSRAAVSVAPCCAMPSCARYRQRRSPGFAPF